MSASLLAFALLLSFRSMKQLRCISAEQLDTELHNLLHQWPRLVQAISEGEAIPHEVRPSTEIQSMCTLGILTTLVILISSVFILCSGGPSGLLMVCLAMVGLNVLVYLRGRAGAHYSEGALLLASHNFLEALLLGEMSLAFHGQSLFPSQAFSQ